MLCPCCEVPPSIHSQLTVLAHTGTHILSWSRERGGQTSIYMSVARHTRGLGRCLFSPHSGARPSCALTVSLLFVSLVPTPPPPPPAPPPPLPAPSPWVIGDWIGATEPRACLNLQLSSYRVSHTSVWRVCFHLSQLWRKTLETLTNLHSFWLIHGCPCLPSSVAGRPSPKSSQASKRETLACKPQSIPATQVNTKGLYKLHVARTGRGRASQRSWRPII